MLYVVVTYRVSKSYNAETKHFWPHIGKAKMLLALENLFEKLYKQTADKNVNKCSKSRNILA